MGAEDIIGLLQGRESQGEVDQSTTQVMSWAIEIFHLNEEEKLFSEWFSFASSLWTENPVWYFIKQQLIGHSSFDN